MDLSSANAPDGVVLASTGLEAFVIASKLWDPATGAFSFFKAFHEDSAVDASANCECTQSLNEFSRAGLPCAGGLGWGRWKEVAQRAWASLPLNDRHLPLP